MRLNRFTMDDLLDAAKVALDCANDSELADALGVSASRICNYRKGRTLPNLWMARRLARILRVAPAEVITRIRREKEARQRRSEVR